MAKPNLNATAKSLCYSTLTFVVIIIVSWLAEALEWSPYTPCTVTCGVGKRTRSRMCDGVSCPKSGRELETVSCIRPGCPGNV